jgi:hypothetical protein
MITLHLTSKAFCWNDRCWPIIMYEPCTWPLKLVRTIYVIIILTLFFLYFIKDSYLLDSMQYECSLILSFLLTAGLQWRVSQSQQSHREYASQGRTLCYIRVYWISNYTFIFLLIYTGCVLNICWFFSGIPIWRVSGNWSIREAMERLIDREVLWQTTLSLNRSAFH